MKTNDVYSTVEDLIERRQVFLTGGRELDHLVAITVMELETNQFA
jgi:hypothetical protein